MLIPFVNALLTVGLALLGLIFGSFLNVVIARVPEEQSIIRPRSRCPKCGHQLAWFENVPVFSWLALRARCRSCKEPISWRYPAVELLTGGLFLLCLQRFDWTYPLVPALMLVLLLVPLTFIDLEHWILPFELTLPGIALGLVLAWVAGVHVLIGSAIGAAVGFFAFWALEWLGQLVFKKEALGGGDKYLLALIGAFLGWRPLLGVIFLASLQGGVIGSILLLVRGRAGPEVEPATALPEGGTGEGSPTDPKPADAAESEFDDGWEPGPTNIPFGPWLSIAALELLFLGPWLSAHLSWPLSAMLTGM